MLVTISSITLGSDCTKVAYRANFGENDYHSFNKFCLSVTQHPKSNYNFAASSSKFVCMQKIVSVLLLLVVAVGALLPHLCECPSSEKEIQKHSSNLRVIAQDICTDCGHTRSCCFSKTQLPNGLVTNMDSLACWSIVTVLVSSCLSRFDFPPNEPIAPLSNDETQGVTRWPCLKTYLAKQSLLI